MAVRGKSAFTTCKALWLFADNTLAHRIATKEKKGLNEARLLAKKEKDDIRSGIKQKEEEWKVNLGLLAPPLALALVVPHILISIDSAPGFYNLEVIFLSIVN